MKVMMVLPLYSRDWSERGVTIINERVRRMLLSTSQFSWIQENTQNAGRERDRKYQRVKKGEQDDEEPYKDGIPNSFSNDDDRMCVSDVDTGGRVRLKMRLQMQRTY